MDDVRKEMFKLWKASWEGYAKSIQTMRDQGDKMLEMLFAQGEAFKGEAQKSLQEMSANTKKAQDAFFKAIEDNLAKMEETFKSEK
ncbi:MAG: hypothetical protein AB1641_11950 [Thermodesulfobacteriota bacterium]